MVSVEPKQGDSAVPEVETPPDEVNEPASLQAVESSISPTTHAHPPADFAVTVHADTVLEGDDNPDRVSPRLRASNAPEKEKEIQTATEINNNIDTALLLPATPKARGSTGRRTNRRKRGRVVRAVEVNEVAANDYKSQALLLPSNQYETNLCRRAVRKRDDKEAPAAATPVEAEENSKDDDSDSNDCTEQLEVYGDISLGMKLSVVGGKVIVQHLNALADGRASPAQLTGVVQRGDVLLSINDIGLVNLPIDQLMAGLGPLSTPDATGAYQRNLKLRFAAAEGLDLLTKSEAAKKGDANGSKVDRQQRSDAAQDMFNLFPMVDQLSGMPMFEDQSYAEPTKEADEAEDDQEPALAPSQAEIDVGKKITPLDEMISYKLAMERILDKTLFTSEFFGWNEQFSDLLRQSIPINKDGTKRPPTETRSLTELIELGRRAILGAKALSKGLENVDRGLDVRSFRSWNSTISLYSRASTRRRYVLDAASLPVNFGKVVEEEDEDADDDEGSQGSGGSDDEEQLDGDGLLLRLASHDEIWRKQVVEFLESAIQHAQYDDFDAQAPEDYAAETGDIDSALSKELGSFLFGENMSKILTKNKKPQALPPEEITAVLFDLTTKVSSTVPDRIAAAGSLVSYRSSLVPFTGIKRPNKESDAMLATHFLLHEALPVWLKTFRPLPWEHRRVLWPLEKASSGESTVASTLSDDSLTLDSFGTRQTSQSTAKHRKRKNLREMIEDQQLDVETRSETCFLVTYFFTQKMLPRLLHKKDPAAFQIALEETSAFVKGYGSYLKMHTCIAYSALLKAEEVIDILLESAKYDPRHREMMKVTSKANALVFYEPTMLSTVIQRLHQIRTEAASDRRLPTIDLCAAAFPDVRPWQVQKECVLLVEAESKELKAELGQFYYTYLSLLLHPLDGHKAARLDPNLVKEWCELSTTGTNGKTKDSRKNFFCVAARTSSDHLCYRRDLVMLLRCSMRIDEDDLALDLAGEIIDSPSLSKDDTVVGLVLGFMREIGAKALDTEGQGRKKQAARILKRIIRLHHKASMKESLSANRLCNISDELLHLLEHRKNHIGGMSSPKKLIDFFADEADPSDVLQTLSTWTTSSETTMDTIPVLHKILSRGAHASMSSELSGSLLSLKRARLRMNEDTDSGDATESSEHTGAAGTSEPSTWKKMASGMVVVAK